jgi:hypothetical protein
MKKTIVNSIEEAEALVKAAVFDAKDIKAVNIKARGFEVLDFPPNSIMQLLVNRWSVKKPKTIKDN